MLQKKATSYLNAVLPQLVLLAASALCIHQSFDATRIKALVYAQCRSSKKYKLRQHCAARTLPAVCGPRNIQALQKFK
jgi:hypothetical protein